MTDVNELSDLNEMARKPSFCYGCGQELRSYSLLVCSECLSNECDKFVNLVAAVPAVPKAGRQKKGK